MPILILHLLLLYVSLTPIFFSLTFYISPLCLSWSSSFQIDLNPSQFYTSAGLRNCLRPYCSCLRPCCTCVVHTVHINALTLTLNIQCQIPNIQCPVWMWSRVRGWAGLTFALGSDHGFGRDTIAHSSVVYVGHHRTRCTTCTYYTMCGMCTAHTYTTQDHSHQKIYNRPNLIKHNYTDHNANHAISVSTH